MTANKEWTPLDEPYEIIDAPMWWHLKGLSETASGYGKRLNSGRADSRLSVDSPLAPSLLATVGLAEVTSMRKVFSFPSQVAWTGGDSPREYRDVVLGNSTFGQWFRYLRHRFFREQILAWRVYWGDMPDRDTRHTFWNRASYDSWATLRHHAPALYRKVTGR